MTIKDITKALGLPIITGVSLFLSPLVFAGEESLRENTSAWDFFASFFSNITSNFTLYMDIAAPVHGAMLATAWLLVFSFGLPSLGYSLVGKSLGAHADPGHFFRTLIVITLMLMPVKYSAMKFDAASPESKTALSEKISDGIISKRLKESAQGADDFYVTFSFMLLHRIAIGIHALVADMLDQGLSFGGVDDSTGVPYRAFRAFNISYAKALSDTKGTQKNVLDYLVLCNTPVNPQKRDDNSPTKNTKVPLKQWRILGLQGSNDLGRGKYVTQENGEISGQLNANYSTEALQRRYKLAPDAISVLKDYYPNGKGVPIQINGYQIPTREYWQQKFAKKTADADSDTGLEIYYTKPIDGTEPMPDVTAEPGVYYPKSCYDLLQVADRTMAEYRAGFTQNEYSLYRQGILVFKKISGILPGLVINKNLADKLKGESSIAAAAFVDNIVGTYQREGRDYSGLTGTLREVYDDTAIAAKKGVAIIGGSLYELFNEFKIEYDIPIFAGFIGFIYALLFVFWPLIIAFSVIYGRGSSLALLISVFAYLHTVMLLAYIVIKIGAMITVSLSQSVSANYGDPLTNMSEIATQAFMAQSFVIIGIFACLPFAYFIVFNDKLSLKSLSSKGFGSNQVLGAVGTAATAAAAVATRGVSASVGAARHAKTTSIAEARLKLAEEAFLESKRARRRE